MGQKRLFFAWLIPPSEKALLAEKQIHLAKRVRALGFSLRPLKPENFHITLHFLGETDELWLPILKETLRLWCAGSKPLTIGFDRFGFFGSAQSPRVIWAGFHPEQAAIEEQRNFNRLLASRFETLGEDGFRPHVTLAYVTKPHRLHGPVPTSGPVASGLSRSAWEDFGPLGKPFVIDRAGLFESLPGAHGSEYRSLLELPLS